MKNVATAAGTLSVVGVPGGTHTGGGGVAAITSVPSLSVKVGGAGVYRAPLLGTLSGVVSVPPGHAQVTPVPFSIPASASKVSVDGVLVCLENDSVEVLVPLVNTEGAPSGTAKTKISISAAGQSAVRGE